MSTASIDLDASINSGQVFLWTKCDHIWYGVNGQDIIKMSAESPACPASQAAYDFFRMSDDYSSILDGLSSCDDTIRYAIERYRGLRLLRQDPFQCLITFIASSNSSIPNIRRSLQRLCSEFGRRLDLDGQEYVLFPEAQALARADAGEIRRCGLGYRAKYVQAAANMVYDGTLDLRRLRSSGYDATREALLETPGVGDKVADCVMLFSLEKLDAFPLDRWMGRVISRYYPEMAPGGHLTPRIYTRMHNSLAEYFGPNAGYAQQFLFKMQRDEVHSTW